jgi:hypothetical protein
MIWMNFLLHRWKISRGVRRFFWIRDLAVIGVFFGRLLSSKLEFRAIIFVFVDSSLAPVVLFRFWAKFVLGSIFAPRLIRRKSFMPIDSLRRESTWYLINLWTRGFTVGGVDIRSDCR